MYEVERNELLGVYAIRSGIVEGVFSNFVSFDGKGYGLTVFVGNADDRLLIQYSHLSKSVVREGQYVMMGQLIGIMGNSGTNQVHLHISIHNESTKINDINTV